MASLPGEREIIDSDRNEITGIIRQCVREEIDSNGVEDKECPTSCIEREISLQMPQHLHLVSSKADVVLCYRHLIYLQVVRHPTGLQ